MQLARYNYNEHSAIRCELCPHSCLIEDGASGLCLARANIDGILYADSYGQVTSMALDPIEKKPLNRFHPGSKILSIGSYGCNMSCSYCQNYGISTVRARSEYISPEDLVATAEEAHCAGNIGVAFTYNEPLIWPEYILDTAPLLRERGLKTVLVTNGLANSAVIADLLPWIDAVNVDLKAYDEDFYLENNGYLKTVKRSIMTLAADCHVELTTLIIPGRNDDPDMMEAQVEWIAGISPDIPLHLSRFFPNYHMMETEPTPISTLRKLAEVARDKLRYVYLGNV